MVKLAGLGPVISREWRALARRWHWYAGRALFVLGMLGALTVVAWTEQTGRSRDPRRAGGAIAAAAQVGRRFFGAIVAAQLGLVLVAAPAGLAGAICLEKERGTLVDLLVTDLSGAEVVLGKLAAHLIPVVGMIACAVPVMELATLLGGVEPDALLGASLIAGGSAIVGCALALTFSVWGTRTHEVLLATYGVGAAWLGTGPGWWFFNRIGWLVSGPPAWLFQSNPLLLTFGLAWGSPRTTWWDIEQFVAGTLLAALLLTGLAILRLRPVAVGQLDRPVHRRGGGRFGPWRGLGPSLDANPVLWREWYRRSPAGWARIIWVLYGLIASASTATMIALIVERGLGKSTLMASLLNGIQVAAGMLLVVVLATTTLASERTRGGWDALLATPLETRTIVLGKWWGAFRAVPLIALPTGLTALAVATQSGRYGGVALVVGVVLTYGAALSSLGLALSTWVPQVGRAATLGVAAHVLVTVGWFFLIILMMPGAPGFLGPGMGSASPFLAVFFTTLAMHPELKTNWSEVVGWEVFWMVIELLATAVLLAATLATFDRCLGRISGSPGPTASTRKPRRSRAG
jgi:ABC-type transport system involved in multi-copper enzyme maturation permease subunit